MKYKKPHFVLNKKQRNGVFAFVVLLILVQFAIELFTVNTIAPAVFSLDAVFEKKIDSIKLANQKKKIKKINPNFITDGKGYFLGLSVEEIDKLHAYRNSDNWVNSIEDFKRVTGVNDSLLNKLKSQFYFPVQQKSSLKVSKKSLLQIYDANKATILQFALIDGVGEVLAKRIISYRTKLKGFTYQDQFDEVYGLSDKALIQLKKHFKIYQKPIIEKINLNTATFKEVLAIVYLDYETTKLLFNYRRTVGVIEHIDEIKKIPGFPVENYDRITLYLHAE